MDSLIKRFLNLQFCIYAVQLLYRFRNDDWSLFHNNVMMIETLAHPVLDCSLKRLPAEAGNADGSPKVPEHSVYFYSSAVINVYITL